MVTADGYIHPIWGVHRITGRWSSSPATQNWSKRAGGGEENLRAMIEAPEGYTFVGADQCQLESRLVGAMSQCTYLLNVFKNGEDVHSAFAAIGFPNDWPRLAATWKEHKKAMAKGEKCHCETCAERDKVRDLTKRMEYGGIYGGQDKTIWESIVGDFPSLTQRQVRLFLDSFNTNLPEVLAWRAQTLREATQEGEIRSPILGRRQVFPLGRVDPTVAYNYKAQAGGADLWALGAIEFMQRWDQFDSVDARLIHNGHDSVLVLVREDLAKQVEKDVYECWSREWAGVPFIMETKIAKQWSEA
jgi:DNA polymerase-1